MGVDAMDLGADATSVGLKASSADAEKTSVSYAVQIGEQQALAKKIEAGWTNAIDRLRPKSNPNSQRRLRQGYTAQPRHGTKTEMLDQRAENKRPKPWRSWKRRRLL